MITTTGIVCSSCERGIELVTKGICGGIIRQILYSEGLKKLRREGGTIECNHCGHKQLVPPQLKDKGGNMSRGKMGPSNQPKGCSLKEALENLKHSPAVIEDTIRELGLTKEWGRFLSKNR